jgi:hypothetical protein
MSISNPITPPTGDVVLKREVRSAGSNYSVRQVPGGAQVLCNSRERALTFATVFARRHHVTLWEEQDGAYTQLAPASRESGQS